MLSQPQQGCLAAQRLGKSQANHFLIEPTLPDQPGADQNVLEALVLRLVFYSGNVPNSMRSELRSCLFHNDVYVFIGMASRTGDKILLVEETDYDS